MPAALAARVAAFARACKAAARSVALYPGEHPAVAAALDGVTAAARAAAAHAPLRLAVLPDELTVDGCGMARPESAVSDLAALLHRHQIGQLTIAPQSDAEVWRRFLALLALPPDQARLRGGIGKLWASEGESRIEILALDYNEMLRSRVHGDRATWEAVVASCLEGSSITLDDAMVEMLFAILGDPDRILTLAQAVEARLPATEAEGQCPRVLAGLLRALAQFVSQTAPEESDRVMTAIAEAATRLPLDTLGPIMEGRRGASRPGLAQFVQGLGRRASDESVASLIAQEVRKGNGTSPCLADAFCGLAPDPQSRSAILTIARQMVTAAPGAMAGPTAAAAWQQSEDMLLAYSNQAFVSDAYHAELSRLADRAVDLERDHTDAPDVVAAWCRTVEDDQLRLLDAGLMADLMQLQQDLTLWRDLAGLALERVNALLVVGDFPAAALLAEAMRSQAEGHADEEIRSEAADTLRNFLTPSTMRHVAFHLDTANREMVGAAQRFCAALGTVAIRPLAEVLSTEERNRPRQHLIEILIGFGAAGRQSVERLRKSPNAAVRRTAVLLLREFGGQEALPELAALLDDTEPHVQREATRAVAMLGTEPAYDVLIRALERGTEQARTSILGVVASLPEDEREQVLSRLILKAPYRAALWAFHGQAIERLGAAAGGRLAVDALSEVLQRRSLWSPFKMAYLHRRAVDALAQIGTPDALAAIEGAAAYGSRAGRAAARACLEARGPREKRKERTE
jgi:hypothetical protein